MSRKEDPGMSAGIGITGIYVGLLVAILIFAAVICYMVGKSRSEIREERKAMALLAMNSEKRAESVEAFMDETKARGAEVEEFMRTVNSRGEAADAFMANAESRAQAVDAFMRDAKAGMVLIDQDILDTKASGEALFTEVTERLTDIDAGMASIDANIADINENIIGVNTNVADISESVGGISEKVSQFDLKEIIRAAGQAAAAPRQITVEPIRRPAREKKVVMIDDRLSAPAMEPAKPASAAAAEPELSGQEIFEPVDTRTREEELGDLGLIWDSGKEPGVWDLEPEQITKADIQMPSIRKPAETVRPRAEIKPSVIPKARRREPAYEAISSQVAEPVVKTVIPAVEPVVETVLPAAEPVVKTAIPTAEPVVETVIPAAEPVVETVLPAQEPAPKPEPLRPSVIPKARRREPRPVVVEPIPQQTAPEEQLEMREFLKDVRNFRERRESGAETEPVEEVIYGKPPAQEPPVALRLAKFTDRDSGVDKDGKVFTVEELRMQIR